MNEPLRPRVVALHAANQYRATVQISDDARRAYEADMQIERLTLDLQERDDAPARAHRENAQLRAQLARVACSK